MTARHPYVQLAVKAIEEYVKLGEKIDVPSELAAQLPDEKAGVFVSLKKSGELRGCIGTIEPVQKNIAEEIIENAISAANRDPRFSPVRAGELDEIDYSVDVLTSPEPISGMDELDPAKYGVIVESGMRRGLLLPDLEGVDTVEYQVGIAMRKAGISENEPVRMYRFEVIRYR